MVVISLARMGRKKLPFYHIIARNKTAKRDSAIEKIGHYNPFTKALSIDVSKYEYWRGVGAQPTQTAKSLFMKHTKNISEAAKS